MTSSTIVCVRVGVGGDGNVHDYYEQFNVCAYNYLEIESGAISMWRCAFICLCCTRSAITFYTSCMTDELHESSACSCIYSIRNLCCLTATSHAAGYSKITLHFRTTDIGYGECTPPGIGRINDDR